MPDPNPYAPDRVDGRHPYVLVRYPAPHGRAACSIVCYRTAADARRAHGNRGGDNVAPVIARARVGDLALVTDGR